MSEQSWQLDAEGNLPVARHIPSPNCDDRPASERVRLIVLHAISLPPGQFGGEGIIRLFTNTLDASEHPYYEKIRDLRVSAHFLVRRDGELIQFVPCNRRAWHAGVSNWRGHERCNDFSLGIELEGCDEQPFTQEQYRLLQALLKALKQAYPVEAIVGHADIAPGRKTDPGPWFDWRQVDADLA